MIGVFPLTKKFDFFFLNLCSEKISVVSIKKFSKYQTLIKAFINTPYKRNKNFQRFLKKKI